MKSSLPRLAEPDSSDEGENVTGAVNYIGLGFYFLVQIWFAWLMWRLSQRLRSIAERFGEGAGQ